MWRSAHFREGISASDFIFDYHIVVRYCAGGMDTLRVDDGVGWRIETGGACGSAGASPSQGTQFRATESCLRRASIVARCQSRRADRVQRGGITKRTQFRSSRCGKVSGAKPITKPIAGDDSGVRIGRETFGREWCGVWRPAHNGAWFRTMAAARRLKPATTEEPFDQGITT
jgi:hypothetical protein